MGVVPSQCPDLTGQRASLPPSRGGMCGYAPPPDAIRCGRWRRAAPCARSSAREIVVAQTNGRHFFEFARPTGLCGRHALCIMRARRALLAGLVLMWAPQVPAAAAPRRGHSTDTSAEPSASSPPVDIPAHGNACCRALLFPPSSAPHTQASRDGFLHRSLQGRAYARRKPPCRHRDGTVAAGRHQSRATAARGRVGLWGVRLGGRCTSGMHCTRRGAVRLGGRVRRCVSG